VIWRLLPLIGMALFVGIVFCWRPWLQFRRHGTWGIVLFRSRRQAVRDASVLVWFALPVVPVDRRERSTVAGSGQLERHARLTINPRNVDWSAASTSTPLSATRYSECSSYCAVTVFLPTRPPKVAVMTAVPGWTATSSPVEFVDTMLESLLAH
jgi:hypothetical protein